MSDLVIRVTKGNQAKQLIPLWQAAFPSDPLDYIENFIDHLPQSSVTLTGESNDKLVTMLFLLPAVARFRGQAYPVRYLYAGCTHPQHRGRGYYRELMHAAAQTVRQMGGNAIYLHPADDILTATYQRLGYRTGIAGGHVSRMNAMLPICQSVDAYMQKRDQMIDNVSRDTVFWNTAEDVTRFFISDAVNRGARMSADDNSVQLSMNDAVIETVPHTYLHKNNDYCLWLPIGDTPLTTLMADYDGATGIVGD